MIITNLFTCIAWISIRFFEFGMDLGRLLDFPYHIHNSHTTPEAMTTWALLNFNYLDLIFHHRVVITMTNMCLPRMGFWWTNHSSGFKCHQDLLFSSGWSKLLCTNCSCSTEAQLSYVTACPFSCSSCCESLNAICQLPNSSKTPGVTQRVRWQH